MKYALAESGRGLGAADVRRNRPRVARTLFLAPAVGDFRARQLAVVSGSLLVLAISCLTIRWLQPRATRSLVIIGVVWVVLTLDRVGENGRNDAASRMIA